VAHIEELRPQHRRPAETSAPADVQGRPLDWTVLVVPLAVITTLVWVGFLLWVAVRAVEIVLA
jgi:hypothetical protein